MKKYWCALLLLLSLQFGFGRVLSVEIGIDGLTCSMCSRSVEMAIKKLNFVESIEMDLERTHGIIKLKDSVNIDYQKIAQAVKDAGFSLRFLKINIDQCPTIENNQVILQENVLIHLYGSHLSTKSNQAAIFTLIGSDYMDKKNLRKYEKQYSDIKEKPNTSKEYLALIE
jgi:copper chaperone CopZ